MGMTHEEAIKRYDRIRYNLLNHDDKEAVDIVFEALREQPRWISVEERLPEKDKDVMCYSNKNGGHMFFGYRGWISGEWMEGGSLHIGDVTHWMPLPDAPEVEG